MKTLFLVRHAKSSRDDPTLPDRARPLNDRGLRDAPAMGKRLAKRGVMPDRLVSSPALRALTTAQLFADELGVPRTQIVVDETLYAIDAQDLLAMVRALDDRLDRVMLFGHNPTFSELARHLSGTIREMSTCAVAEFRYGTKAWSDVGAVRPAHVSQDDPKS